jgi:hypothetical protein
MFESMSKGVLQKITEERNSDIFSACGKDHATRTRRNSHGERWHGADSQNVYKSKSDSEKERRTKWQGWVDRNVVKPSHQGDVHEHGCGECKPQFPSAARQRLKFPTEHSCEWASNVCGPEKAISPAGG